MKSALFITTVCLIGLVSSASAQLPSRVEASPDIGLSLQVVFPGAGNYDLYDSGVSVEAQFRDWFNDPWGYALAIGYGRWSTDRNAKRPGAGLTDFSGDLEIVPFGASALYRFHYDRDLSVVLDVGLRYIIADSKIKASYAPEGGTRRYPVKIDDSVLARFAVGVDYRITDELIWSFNAGYYYDLDRGDLSTEIGKARENIMESFYVETGLRLPL
ncbi:MAG TPA: outer membrane beta-barrel protein [Kiritimatiellia bacterium]|nr:outer membrane beta-barrel protein [Kiritimatiellia bacterium]